MKRVHVVKCLKSVLLGTATAAVALALLTQAGATAAEGKDTGDAYYEVDPNWPQPLHPGTDLDFTRTGAVFAESPDRIFVFQTGELPKSYKGTPVNDPLHPNWPSRPGPNAFVCGQTSADICPPGSPPMYYRKYGSGPMEPIAGSKWEHLLFVVDGKGKLIESWEQWNHLFTHPHGIAIDPNDPERHVWLVDSSSDQIYKFTHDGKKLVMTLGEFRKPGNDKTHLGGPNGIAFRRGGRRRPYLCR
jgi:hypothetical protein